MSWVGGGKLAIVRVFKELEKSNNKAEIVTYSFTPETMELSETGNLPYKVHSS